MRVPTAAMALVLLASSCNNPCQRVCVRMQTFAEDCGFKVADAEVDACLDEQADASSEDKKTCRESGDLATIERTWDCAEAEKYWGAATAGS